MGELMHKGRQDPVQPAVRRHSDPSMQAREAADFGMFAAAGPPLTLRPVPARPTSGPMVIQAKFRIDKVIQDTIPEKYLQLARERGPEVYRQLLDWHREELITDFDSWEAALEGAEAISRLNAPATDQRMETDDEEKPSAPVKDEDPYVDSGGIIQPGARVTFTWQGSNMPGFVSKYDPKKERYSVTGDGKHVKGLLGGPVTVPKDAVVRDRTENVSKKPRSVPKAKNLPSAQELTDVQEFVSPLGPILSRNPDLFGPVMIQGGQVPMSKFRKTTVKDANLTRKREAESDGSGDETSQPKKKKKKVAGARRKTKRAQKEGKEPVVFTGQNTMSMLSSRTTLGGLSEGYRFHGKDPTDMVTEDELEEQRKEPLEFHDQFVWKQGAPSDAKRDRYTLPPKDKRSSVHAEIKSARSESMEALIAGAIKRIGTLLEAFIGSDWRKVLEGGESEDLFAGLSDLLGPMIQEEIIVLINRSSCGTKKLSGYSGGCARELADILPALWAKFEAAFGKTVAYLLRELANVSFLLSVAGEYAEPGDIGQDLEAGWNIGVHNTYDFSQNQLTPITREQHSYMTKIKDNRDKPTPSTSEKATTSKPPSSTPQPGLVRHSDQPWEVTDPTWVMDMVGTPPQVMLDQGIQTWRDGETVIINGHPFRVVIKKYARAPTDDNPMGDAMYVTPKLRGG